VKGDSRSRELGDYFDIVETRDRAAIVAGAAGPFDTGAPHGQRRPRVF